MSVAAIDALVLFFFMLLLVCITQRGKNNNIGAWDFRHDHNLLMFLCRVLAVVIMMDLTWWCGEIIGLLVLQLAR